MDEQKKREKAWTGDAVLSLFAREWILTQVDIPVARRSEEFAYMTSNRFLSCFGQPTAVEAAIGAIYHRDGLDAAFDHIRSEILPLARSQRLKRERKSGQTRKKT